jgi:hypothetical protein
MMHRHQLVPVLVIICAIALLIAAARGFTPHRATAADGDGCTACHASMQPAVVAQWEDSTHAAAGVGCADCHSAQADDADAFEHNGYTIATVVTPLDCSGCHATEYEEFVNSHHAAGGDILDSMSNYLAEVVEGLPSSFAPHGPTPGRPELGPVYGQASAQVGCAQCHGAKLALMGTDGSAITVDELDPGIDGQPRNTEAVELIQRNSLGAPVYDPNTWPNTGIGRLNLDGSRGSCSACHSRHDFSRRRARRPDNCGKCHMGPDHPQKEIYYESKHGVAYEDYRDELNLDSPEWVLGEDYHQAPTCATCHVSGHSANGGKVSHDVGMRLSWNNKGVLSRWYDTDAYGNIVTATDEAARAAQVTESGWDKRQRMQAVCLHCHGSGFVDGFYTQYDNYIQLYNEKFARPGSELMQLLAAEGLVTGVQFDEEIEWVWWELWHHQGRRGRHGASMMGPDYAHWHGMYEVADSFYMELLPMAEELAHEAEAQGNDAAAEAVRSFISSILERPEHEWFSSAP